MVPLLFCYPDSYTSFYLFLPGNISPERVLGNIRPCTFKQRIHALTGAYK
jgi:hypothetical protein